MGALTPHDSSKCTGADSTMIRRDLCVLPFSSVECVRDRDRDGVHRVHGTAVYGDTSHERRGEESIQYEKKLRRCIPHTCYLRPAPRERGSAVIWFGSIRPPFFVLSVTAHACSIRSPASELRHLLRLSV